MWLRGWRLEPEQVAGRPAERLGLLAPAGEEAPAILDGDLPAVDRDQVEAAGFEGGVDALVSGWEGCPECPTVSRGCPICCPSRSRWSAISRMKGAPAGTVPLSQP